MHKAEGAGPAWVLKVGHEPPVITRDPEDDEEERVAARATRKVSLVLLPLLFLVGTSAYLDKGNLAFAAIKLNAQLDFSPQAYGLGSGMFYAGFGAAILPSTFMTMKYGARWFGFITVCWGVVGTCHALVRGRASFFVLRLLLGLAEAGGAASGGHLLAQFYPRRRLALPFSVVAVSSMVSGVIAAPLAAGLMSLDGVGSLAGWQWLFILEGVPSVLLGVVMVAILPSSPLTAWMLAPGERELLHLRVHGSPEAAAAARTPPRWRQLLALVWDAARRPALWLFIAVGFLWALGFMSLNNWLPILVNNALSGTALSHSSSSGAPSASGGGSRPAVGSAAHQSTTAILLSGVPTVCASVAMLLCAWSSDRRGEKTLHVAVPYTLAGVVLALFTPLYSASFGAGFAALVLGVVFANMSMGVFNARVAACLDARHVGVGLALYSAICACLAGFAGPVVVGAMVQRTGSFGTATVAMGAILTSSGLLMFGLAVWEALGCRRRRACGPAAATSSGGSASAAASAAAVAAGAAPA